MLADLNTKSHPFARLDHLRRLWGIREVEETKSEVNKIKVQMMRAYLPLIPEDSESPESSPKGTDQPPVQREVEETPGESSQGSRTNKQPRADEDSFEDLFKADEIGDKVEKDLAAINKKEDEIRESYGEPGRRRTVDEERLLALMLLTIERERTELFRKAHESEAIFRIEAED